MCKISLNAVKFMRGQVWFVREDDTVTKALRDAGSRVINGSRPYLVVNVVNDNLVTVCPLTTNLNEQHTGGNDIVFDHVANVTGGGYSSSRIIISQIQTKNTSELERYLYSFDQESIDIIMRHVYSQLGMDIAKKKDENTHEVSKPKRVNINEYETVSADELVGVSVSAMTKLENRLRDKAKGLRKREPLFCSKEEANLYMDYYGIKKTKYVADHFNAEIKTVYKWKNAAKNKAMEA